MSIEKPQVSVILPTYNRANYIQWSIASVLNQTYMDWELIVWDDGSDDGTSDLCRSVSDDRIHYYWQENRGVSYARNQAIANSNGDYLAFLDSDDEWLPEKLAVQVEIIQKYPNLDFIFGNFRNKNLRTDNTSIAFDQLNHPLSKLQSKKLEDNNFLIEDKFLECIASENLIATDTVIIKRELIQNHGGFNESLRNGEDFELWWRLGLAGSIIGYTDKVLLNRYKPTDSLSSQSIASLYSAIKTLDICSENACQADRSKLNKYLNKPYRNAWQNMITACAMENDKKGMMNAFKQSLKYGFRPGSLRLLVEGLLKSGDTK